MLHMLPPKPFSRSKNAWKNCCYESPSTPVFLKSWVCEAPARCFFWFYPHRPAPVSPS